MSMERMGGFVRLPECAGPGVTGQIWLVKRAPTHLRSFEMSWRGGQSGGKLPILSIVLLLRSIHVGSPVNKS